jgi:hypothetical protein
MKILKDCAVPILLFAMFFGGYAYFFLPRLEPMWLAYVFAGVAALMLYIALGAITTLFRSRTIATVMRGVRQMHTPEDGKLALVQGAIVIVGETLHAPFSNKSCVSYEYHMYRAERTDSRRTSSGEGTGYRTAKESFAFAWFSSPPLSKDARPYRDESFQFVAQSASADVIREICQGGVDPNERNTFGTPPIFMVREADKLQALLDCGADPNLHDADGETKLSEAARYGDVESLRALLKAGAEIEAEIPEFGRGWTAMVSAYTSGSSEAVDFLAEAGAFDERVTAATGEPLTEESAPMQTVRAYLAAIQAGDLQAMERLRTGVSPGWSEEIALQIWQKYYPSEPILKQGFGNDHAATIELEAHMIEGFYVRQFLHLEYVIEQDTPQWLILRQWDEPLPE